MNLLAHQPANVKDAVASPTSARENHNGCECEGSLELQVGYLAGTGNDQLGSSRTVAG